MTHKEKCCLFCTGENLFLLLPEQQGAADKRLFTAINMRPVIVAIIPSSPQRPSIVSCPALLCFVSGFFFFLRCIVSDNRVWQGWALMCGEAVQSIRCFEKVKRSQLELRWVVWKGRAGQGTARRTCLCNTTHTGGNSKCSVRVDLISQYSVFSVYSARRIWISDQFSLLPLSDREGFQHEGQSKFPSELLKFRVHQKFTAWRLTSLNSSSFWWVKKHILSFILKKKKKHPSRMNKSLLQSAQTEGGPALPTFRDIWHPQSFLLFLEPLLASLMGSIISHVRRQTSCKFAFLS